MTFLKMTQITMTIAGNASMRANGANIENKEKMQRRN